MQMRSRLQRKDSSLDLVRRYITRRKVDQPKANAVFAALCVTEGLSESKSSAGCAARLARLFQSQQCKHLSLAALTVAATSVGCLEDLQDLF